MRADVEMCETELINISKRTEKQRALRPNQQLNTGEKLHISSCILVMFSVSESWATSNVL